MFKLLIGFLKPYYIYLLYAAVAGVLGLFVVNFYNKSIIMEAKLTEIIEYQKEEKERNRLIEEARENQSRLLIEQNNLLKNKLAPLASYLLTEDAYKKNRPSSDILKKVVEGLKNEK